MGFGRTELDIGMAATFKIYYCILNVIWRQEHDDNESHA
jgi:hypothetical protein